MKIKREHIYAANLNPRFGTEPGKMRPVLVLQTDFLNEHGHSSTIVCLLTTQINKEAKLLRVHLEAGEAGLVKKSDVMIDQIRSIDNRRFKKLLGKISEKLMKEIKQKVMLVLEL